MQTNAAPANITLKLVPIGRNGAAIIVAKNRPDSRINSNPAVAIRFAAREGTLEFTFIDWRIEIVIAKLAVHFDIQ